MRYLVLGSLLCFASLSVVGCGSKDNDPNYKTEVKLTPEQQDKLKTDGANQKAPGTVTPGAPIQTNENGAAKLPPGKK